MSFMDILPFVILIFSAADKWFLSLGRLWFVYILTIVGSLSTITYNIMLVNDMNGNHKSLLIFSVSSTWAISMSVAGICRMIKESKKKSKE